MAPRTATAVWLVSPDLLLALDERLGPPVDSYVNGSQVWLTDDGPGGTTLEWRLHPAPGYSTPRGLSHYDLWETAVARLSIAGSDHPEVMALGSESRSLASLWEGREGYPAHGEAREPAPRGAAATDARGVAPERAGLVDHEAVGDEWERSERTASIISLLLAQLTP